MAHARLSPSSAERWAVCTASVKATEGYPNTSNEAARKGTAEHLVLEECVLFSDDPQRYLGRIVRFWEDDTQNGWTVPPGKNESNHVVLEQDACDRVASAVAFVEQVAALTGARVYAERRVPIGHVTGEHGARGTSDIVLLYGRTLHVIDYKGGRMEVRVRRADGQPNLQLALYALGVIEDLGLTEANIDDIVLTVIQPMLGATPETRLSWAELMATGEWLRQRAMEVDADPTYRPGAKACEWCPANGDCPPADDFVLAQMKRSLDGDRLGEMYEQISMARGWADAVEAKVKDALLAGHPVLLTSGEALGLDTGRRGAREWNNDDAVASAMLAAGVAEDLIYEPRVVRSPAKIEGDAKVRRKHEPKIQPVVWLSLQSHIPEPRPGGPVVKPVSEIRDPYLEKRLSGLTKES